MAWTKAQKEAIYARGGNLLVSAAAGSGKTAVLTERIVSLVREGVSIDSMLVVTFTRAAAAEMRARIMTTLHDAAKDGDRYLAGQALRVESADISTLHGFCTKICRNHFQAIGIDPTFRVMEAGEAAILAAQALQDSLLRCYEEPTPAFAHFARTFSQEEQVRLIEQLHAFLMARPDPWPWLADAVAAHAVDAEGLAVSPWCTELLGHARALSEEMMRAYDTLLDFARDSALHVAFTEAEYRLASALDSALREGIAALEAIPAPAFATKPTAKKDQKEADALFKPLRDRAKKALLAVYDVITLLQDIPNAALDERMALPSLEGLAQATQAYHAHFAQLKLDKNVLDFSDLEHYALQALQADGVAQAVRARYAYIFVDEYQDSSLLQEALIQRVARPGGLFLVGDVKQSIYRFRQSDASLFLQKEAEYTTEPGAANRMIVLNANFRSRAGLLSGINEVFTHVFCGGAMELSYPPENWLYPGKEADAGAPDAPIELCVLTGEPEEDAPEDIAGDEEDARSIRQEAHHIAQRILALTAPGEGYKYRDIAVLLRAIRGKAAQVVEVLQAYGIPAWTDQGQDAFAYPEVQQMVALLQVIDNLRQDVPLLSALRGPALQLDDASLAEIRSVIPEKSFADAVLAYGKLDNPLAEAIRGFIERVRGWALDAQVLPLDMLLRRIYDETGYYAQVGAMFGGGTRQANLSMLAEQAASFQRTFSAGLAGFLRYLDDVKKRDGLAAQDLGDGDNVVRIMSIHKSKGLQFPVVFVADLGKAVRFAGGSPLMQLHQGLGVALECRDPEARTRRRTISFEAIRARERRETLAEEARMLYVAMTRAQDRLLLTAHRAQMDEPPEHTPPASARSMLDWLYVPGILRSGHWAVSTSPRLYPPEVSQSAQQDALLDQALALPMPSDDSLAAQRLGWTPTMGEGVPIKQSVSALLHVEQKDGEEQAAGSVEDMPARPLFMELRGMTASERGSAVHAFLAAIPLSGPQAANAAALRDDLFACGILSQAQADSLPLDGLDAFLRGDVWQRVARAQVVHREWPFNLRVVTDGQRTLLQGVIDCCFQEDGAWVLLDYKTNRALDARQLGERYRTQLDLYAQALASISGMPVRERLLCLIGMGETLAI